MLFCRSLVLKITWILLLEYECDMVPSLRDLLSLHPYPALKRWAKLFRPPDWAAAYPTLKCSPNYSVPLQLGKDVMAVTSHCGTDAQARR